MIGSLYHNQRTRSLSLLLYGGVHGGGRDVVRTLTMNGTPAPARMFTEVKIWVTGRGFDGHSIGPQNGWIVVKNRFRLG